MPTARVSSTYARFPIPRGCVKRGILGQVPKLWTVPVLLALLQLNQDEQGFLWYSIGI